MCGRNRQGAQGILDAASNGALEGEFGTSKEEEVVKQILEKGTVQESEVCQSQSHSHFPHLFPHHIHFSLFKPYSHRPTIPVDEEAIADMYILPSRTPSAKATET